MQDFEYDERLMTIVSGALQLQPAERTAYIRQYSAGDGRLFTEATEAVEWEQQIGHFLLAPAFALQPSTYTFENGHIIGERFQLIRKLGEGAMGVVYEALDPKRGCRVAIKIAKAGFNRTFAPELESALRIRHRNVCLVNEIHTARFDGGEVDFLGMELLLGETVSERLSRCGPIAPQLANEIARQLCAGLAEAHRRGVIHRDLKSANVMLTDDADGLRVVIMDFGLSGQMDGSAAVWGTPRYMAPELWQGAQTSPASDHYALGVILFEIVFGSTPSAFSGDEKAAQPAFSVLSRPYRRLLEGCLSLEPGVRIRAFEQASADDYWARSQWTRRKVFGLCAAPVVAAGVGAWFGRDAINAMLQPLPSKRFVALFVDPAVTDPFASPVLTSVIDTVESELSRAEASDRNLFVIAVREIGKSLSQTCDAVGANLALETSYIRATSPSLVLSLVESKTKKLLRRKEITFDKERITALGHEAAQVAALWLNIRSNESTAHPAEPATRSAQAFHAFQSGQQWRAKPNDDGLEQAISSFKTAVETDLRFTRAYAALAIAYCRLYGLKGDPGALELGEANARAALTLDPNSVEGHLALGYVSEKRGRSEEAQNWIQRALALDPTNPRTLLWQAQMYARLHLWSKAEQTFARLKVLRPNYWMAYNDLGYVLDQQGKYREAVTAFQAATLAAPSSAMAFGNLGALFFKLGDLEAARGSFEKSLSLKPTALAYFNLADVWLALSEFSKAVSCSLQSVKLEPSDDTNWLMLGDSYEAWGKHDAEALKAYRRAAEEAKRRLQTDPTDGAACISLALYLQKSHSASEVPALIGRADGLGINSNDSQIAKARALELMGHRREALATLAQCFHKGVTPFEIAVVRDFNTLRSDPAYSQIQRQPKGADN